MTITTVSSGTTTVSTSTDPTSSFIVEGSGTLAVVSGGTVSGLITVSSGGSVNVSSGGSTLDTTILGGGKLIVSGGTASNTTVSGSTGSTSGTEVIRAGSTYDTIVDSNGKLVISGGTAFNTSVFNGGTDFVSGGGTDSGATVSSGGNLTVITGGVVSGATISAGGALNVGQSTSGSFVSSGGTTISTILTGSSGSAAVENVSAGGVASNTSVFSDGSLRLFSGATASNTIIFSGGLEVVNSSGTDIGATVSSGGDLTVISGGVASSTTVSAGGNLQLGQFSSGVQVSAGGTTVSAQVFGNESVQSGGVASDTSVGSGGFVTVLSGGVASNTTVSAGGSLQLGQLSFTSSGSPGTVISAGGTAVSAQLLGSGSAFAFESVLSGGVASSTSVFSAGSLNIASAGTASNTVVFSGGIEVVNSSGTESGVTVSSGGFVTVLSGGVVSGATVLASGTVQLGQIELGVSGSPNEQISAGGTTVSAQLLGTEVVLSGGVASGTVVSGGGNLFNSGGIASGTIVLSRGTDNVGSGTTSGVDIGATVNSGGTLNVASGGVASDTTISGGTMEVQSGGTVSGSITFQSDSGTLRIDGPNAPGQLLAGATISGFAQGDLIDLTGITYSSTNSVGVAGGDELQITEGGVTYDLQLAGDYSGDYFYLSNTPGLGTNITEGNSTPCYCRGTLIRTNRGQTRVENLEIGDMVKTMSKVARPIKWIGRRSYSGRFALGRKDILPICIRAGALDENVPRRDLWISPHHGMYLDGFLIEAKDLVNGVSIVQAERVEKVEYFHIELESHDVIVAEGALSETFIDDDSRGMFHNAHDYAVLYPDAATQPARYCAPRLEDGREVETVRQRIALRAGLLRATDPARIGSLRGYVDLVSPGCIAGWAQDMEQPEAPVCLDIYAGGKLIGQTLANRFRDDLERAGLGSGSHSFEFTPPPGLAIDTVEVRRHADGAALERRAGCIVFAKAAGSAVA